MINNIKLDLYVFMISLFIGLMIVYCTNPIPEVIIKYPTVENVNDTIYIDENNNCYKYKPEQSNCK
tara:strand:+ start:404 stop:601 length:198 start_codon:yes stop_codon:yes gene_type:complete